ncbi:unnamed protein product, partial [marine sediment metagenome]
MSQPRLSEKKRLAILADLQNKLSQRAIAKKHGVSQPTVSNVKANVVKSPEDQPD